MAFLTPLAMLAGLLAVPIILLYMLRLRRRDVVVSSTFLWQQVLLDREANAPWQKLKRNLLLFLQLLILLLLVLALMRPFITVPAVSAGQIAVLLDASASMNATDSADGTRFAEAKNRALEMIETLGQGDQMTLIRVADVPEVLAPYTADAATLTTAVNNAQPSAAVADWSAALTLAAAGAAGAQDFSIVLISDGGLGGATTLPAIPGDVRLIPVGQSGANVAVSALATRTLGGDPPQLFAQITNYGTEDAPVIFDLRVDGELFTAERYTIPAGGTLPLVSENLPAGFSILQAGLTIPSESTVPDYLPTDNTAWAINTEDGARSVLLVSQATGNYFVEQVLRSLPGTNVAIGDPARPLPNTVYDLYIFDGWLPPVLPEADLLIINPPASATLFTMGEQQELEGRPRVNRADPRMTYVDFDSVNIAAFTSVTASWADALIEVDNGPLLLAGNVGGRQVAILPFDLTQSDLPLQITWPILMGSLLDWYRPQALVDTPEGLTIGSSLLVRPPLTAEGLRVLLPNGTTRDLPLGRDNAVFADTTQPGVYTIEVLEGGQVTQSEPFAINLFARQESDLAPRSTVQLGGTTVTEAQEEEIGQREYWPWLALAALVMLLVEWLVYHRRLTVPTLVRTARGKA